MAHKRRSLIKRLEKEGWNYISKLFNGGIGIMNVAASAIGISVCVSYFYLLDELVSIKHLPYLLYVVVIVFSSLTLFLVLRARYWLRDIHLLIRFKIKHREPPLELTRRAQVKVLNLPLFSSVNSMVGWGLGALVVAGYRLISPMPMTSFLSNLVQSARILIGFMVAGLITTGVVFLATEIVCQHIWPYFFPQGGLVNTPGAFRPKLSNRLFANFILTNLLPLVMMAVVSYNKLRMILVMDPSQVISSLTNLILFLLVTALFIAFVVSHMLTHTIVEPVTELEKAMAKVEQGDWNATVTVASNDELGILADRFNRMTQGLIEKERLRRALDLAKEVQQSLMPQQDPSLPGLDIAGSSRYCDETGGDYYDYLIPADGNEIGLVVGDVSGHGIHSALLMASVRAAFRQRTLTAGSLAEIVTDVNRQLTGDVAESGSFMTMFCCRLNPDEQRVTWVSAGHDPGLIYDPKADTFTELAGRNPALGLIQDHRYQESTMPFHPGQILVIGTDGIWEAHTPHGELFGKERLKNTITGNHGQTARQIVDLVIRDVDDHRYPLAREDDVTLVVVKASTAQNEPVDNGRERFSISG